MKTIRSVESCGVCQRVIVESLRDRPMSTTYQRCCARRATLAEAEVPEGTKLATFALGDRVEVELYRGGVQDDDGITRGSKLVTKAGQVGVVEVINGNVYLWVEFDDGGHQSMSAAAENGEKPGYPTVAFRRVPPAEATS